MSVLITRKNPYEKTDWHDHIVDITLPESDPNYVIQEGTRFNESRANNIEEGIYGSYEWLLRHDIDLQWILVQLDLDGRAPGNSGIFADTFEGAPNKLVRHIAATDITAAVAAGTTVLPVDSTDGFTPFTQVTIYDGTNTEDTLITAIGDGTITVQALAHDYVKGARVARSNAKIADGQMINGDWGTYSVAVAEVF